MKNTTKTIIIATLIALAIAARGAQADLVVGYDFDTGANVATRVATSTHSDISATDFGVGAGLIDVLATQSGSGNLDAEGNVFGTANDRNFGGTKNEFGFSSNTLATAITANDYMTFSVTPENSESFDLESFTFRSYIGRNTIRAANSWSLFSSVGGFAEVNAIGAGTTGVNETWTDNVVTLGDEFNNVSAETEFRLYIYGTSGGSSGSPTIFDKVVLNGAVTAVPEPSSLALLAGGLGLLAATRRRRRDHSV